MKLLKKYFNKNSNVQNEYYSFKKCILFDECDGYFIFKRKSDTDWIVYKHNNNYALDRSDYTFEYCPDLNDNINDYIERTSFLSYGDALDGLQTYKQLNNIKQK